jgi:hypothetical protein
LNKLGIATIIMSGLVLGLCGCNKDGSGYVAKPVPKVEDVKLSQGDEKNLFPLVEGNQWVYTSEVVLQDSKGQQRSQKSVLTFAVKSVQSAADGKTGLIEISDGGKVTEKQEWQVTSKGIFQVSAGDKGIKFTPPQLALEFPATAGSTFKWEGKGLLPGGGEGMSKSTGKVLGPQQVDTDLGRMSAIAVETSQQWTADGKPGQASSTVWWAPKVGIVRFHQEIATKGIQAVQTLRLNSKSVKE